MSSSRTTTGPARSTCTGTWTTLCRTGYWRASTLQPRGDGLCTGSRQPAWHGAARIAGRFAQGWSEYIVRLRAWLDQQTFDSLLRYIYATYPEYAKATVLPELVPQQ